MTQFPPEGKQCEGPQTFVDDSAGGCSASLKITNPPSPDPEVPGVGPSVLCWQVTGQGPFPSSIASGSCDPKEPCTFTINVGLDIDPVGPHDEEEHYDFWHGEGEWQRLQDWLAEKEEDPNIPAFVPSNRPLWAIGSSLTAGSAEWGIPPITDPPGYAPNGDSRPRATISASLACGQKPQSVTFLALPASGDVSDAVQLTFEFSCSECPK